MLCDANSSHTARRESKACTSPAPALLWFHRRREEADGPTTPLGLRRGREAKGEKDRKNGSAEAAHAPLPPSSVVLSSDTSVLVCGSGTSMSVCGAKQQRTSNREWAQTVKLKLMTTVTQERRGLM